MPTLLPLSAADIEAFRKSVSPRNPGIGLINLLTGRVRLIVASQLPGGDHSSMAGEVFGIDDIDKAPHLRGFVLGYEQDELWLGNKSGLNPNGKMEPEIFESLKAILKVHFFKFRAKA